jgi:hypothetical protein
MTVQFDDFKASADINPFPMDPPVSSSTEAGTALSEDFKSRNDLDARPLCTRGLAVTDPPRRSPARFSEGNRRV